MTNSFDEFSKTLAESSIPRRESLRQLGAVLAGVFGAWTVGSGSASADAWKRDHRRCKKSKRRKDPCVDFCNRCRGSKQTQCISACRACDNDPKRLRGGCGTYICCAPGLTYCGGRCVDFKTDSNNCGSCGRVCSDGQTCVNGTCSGGGNECDPGLTKCEFACVNLLSDKLNCGSCGNACAAGTTCVNGTCTSADGCYGGQVKCDGICREISQDPSNCGACGVVCGPGQNCVGGVCQDAEGGGGCPGVDLMWDGQNCGACGNVCPPQTACANGVCEGLCIGCG